MGLVDDYKKQVEAFANARLEPYLQAIRAPSWRPPSSKELNDCVWQTVVLQPLEVVVLDSPLLQRLRYVRQLGVAHWTYPGAAHTRFEHSIGAVHQIDRLLSSLAHRSLKVAGEGISPVPDGATVNLLRLAALCHDIGHGAMSHVVENAFKRLGAVADLAMELADELRVEEAKLSEAAAYFLLGSPSFRELINLAAQKTRHDLPTDAVRLLREAVLGRPIHDRYPLLQELINGPFDADKLDYITRDAHMAGVPVVTDIPRLIQKVRAVEVERAALPHAVSKRVSAAHPTYVLYGIALSGGRTLDELMFGRTLLFDKIYRHQKVRAAEAMVSSIVELLLPVVGTRAPILPLLFEDDDLLDISHDGLCERLEREISEEDWHSLAPARDLARRLKERRLFVRAFALAQSMPLDPFRLDEAQRRGFERLLRDSPKPEHRQALVEEIVRHLQRIRALVPEAVPDQFAASLSSYVVLDPPDSFGHPKEIARAYLVSGDQVMPFRDDSAESPAWSAAYLMTRDLGYIFTPAEIALATFLAAEAVFRKVFGIRTPRTAHDYAKIPSRELGELRQLLTKRGFYNDLPNDLRAEPERLRQADVDARIKAVAQRFGTYEGLLPPRGAEEHARVVRVDDVRVMTWLRQFRTDAEVDAALEWVEMLRVVSRQDAHDAVRAFMAQHPEFHGAWVCPLGSPKDSSSIVTYYVADLKSEFELEPDTLANALSTDDSRPILFVDDFIASGGQARTILCGWMADDGAPLRENHGAALPPATQLALRNRKLGFVFVAGEPTGVDALLKEAARLELAASGHVHIDAASLPRAFSSSSGADSAVLVRAGEIGRQLLAHLQPHKDAEWIQARSLGYGNKGYLLVFPYNTPAQALTLLWADGKVDGWDWLALFPRRQKT